MEAASIAREAVEIHGMMRDVSGLVQEQAEAINAVEEHVDDSLAAVQAGNRELTKAADYQRAYRKKCALFGMCIVILIGIIVIPLVIHFLPQLQKNSGGGGSGGGAPSPSSAPPPTGVQAVGGAGSSGRGGGGGPVG